jgi:CCDC81-like prokaryotic HU domain 1/CCDC81-like prokaryotic HU domain 2/SPOR domain
MSIEDLIGDLLMQHNCVIVPSFGGFVAGKIPATFDASKGIMVPPRKSLLFNKQLLNNDGLLAAAYAHAIQVDYNEAFQKIQSTVQLWRSNLENGERITIDRVGFLFLDAERNIGFEQDRFSNLLMSSFGLGKVHFIAKEDIALIPSQIEETPILTFDLTNEVEIGEPVVEERIDSKEEELAPIIPLETNSTKSTIWKYVAAAALVPICFYSYWLPMKTNVLESGMIATEDFNPFHHTSPSTYNKNHFPIDFKWKEDDNSFIKTINHLPKDVAVISYELDPETFVMVKVREIVKTSIQTPISEEVPVPKINLVKETKKITIPVVKTEKVTVNKSITKANNTGNLHLVVGCFSTEQNANELISKLKSNGINAYIVDQTNGLHRVSAVSGNSDSALSSTKEKLATLKMTGWLLRK